MFPFISQSALYYSDPEKEKIPYCRVRFSVCRNAIDSRGRRCFHKVQFLNKTQFPFHITATLWQRNCSRCLSWREHNCEACWHPACSVFPALTARWGAAVRGKAVAQLWLEVFTAKEAAADCAGLWSDGLCPLLHVCHHGVFPLLLSYWSTARTLNSQCALATQPRGQQFSHSLLLVHYHWHDAGTGCSERCLSHHP